MTDLETAYRNISAFYSGTNSDGSAEKWLSKFARTVEAWTICDTILGERRDPLAVCFAAQTIRRKIMRDFRELPAESYISLRNSLTHHLTELPATHDQLTEATVRQLCLAIADLYIQVPEWNNFIAELLNKCHTQEGDRRRTMLTLLRVFPEEIQPNSQMKIGENRRKVIQGELAANGTPVLEYMTYILHQSAADEDMVKRVMWCLAAYLQNPLLSTDYLAQGPLLPAVFQILATAHSMSATTHDAATECVVSALIIAEDQNAHLALATVLQQAIYNLTEAWHVAVAAEDMDKLNNFGRIFTELNETLLEKIVNSASHSRTDLGSLESLELLLLLAGHHDYSLIEKTFTCWYRISEALFMIEDDDHLLQFKPYVNRYMTALYRHSRIEPDEQDIPDENGDFINFRSKVIETVKDVVYIVGTNDCVATMYHLLVECSSRNGSWDEMEAALFIIQAVVRNILPEEDSVVPELTDAIAALPVTSHPALIATSINLLGGCDEWLEKHPQHHEKVLQWLFQLVGMPKFASIASSSINSIAVRSAASLHGLIPALLALIPQLEASAVKGARMESAATNIIKTISKLSMHCEETQMRQTLVSLCQPIVLHLQTILTTDKLDKANNGGNKENENVKDSWAKWAESPQLWIDRIAAIFKEVTRWNVLAGNNENAQRPAPWLDIANELYTVLSTAMEKYKSKERIVEHACRALRYLVRSLGVQSQSFVGPFVELMVRIYSEHQHSCFLYLASILVDEYGTLPDPSIAQGLLTMLQTLSAGTFHLLLKQGAGPDQMLKSMIEHPDTIDDLFRLTGRFVQRAPSGFFLHPISVGLFECALEGLRLDHSQANRSVTKFFVDVIDQLCLAKRANLVGDEGVNRADQLMRTKGADLVFRALDAALFHVSSELRRDMAEVIFCVGKFDKQLQVEWLQLATSRLPRGGLCATDEQLQLFVHNATLPDNGTREVFCQIRDLISLYS